MLVEKFKNPPNEYGEVSFFWWQGDPITKEKLTWILEQLKGKHICGLQINYCHSDQGGLQYGLTMESDPMPFSEKWWELFGWFLEECKSQDISLSLSDYTLGAPGQGYYMDSILQKHPEYIGQKLEYINGEVLIQKVENSINPMAFGVGDSVAEEFYGEFEKHFPGECGKSINYFFSDELNFNIRGNLWSDDFREEFLRRKGYDICKKWEAIFIDCGKETPKIRLDYYDVIVQLSEEAFFAPIYQWHEDRGMTFGCDHGGRGKDVTEFGDYFRTMKWNQGPGNDQPRLESDIIKSKVSASIAHLYKRPRVWLEGFYSSGWQTSCEDVADAVFRNFALGHNLLSLHGLYYSTHGSMWEWAPPCNHYHMPYWNEMGTLLEATKRMSYLLAQGNHCCNVAIVYPVAAVEADKELGEESVKKAFEIAEYLYQQGIDFDFIDFESIQRAVIKEGKLNVSEESYSCVIVPSMQAVRYGMLQKLCSFEKQDGMVLFYGAIPQDSDYEGKDDQKLKEIIKDYSIVDSKEQLLKQIDVKIKRDFLYDKKDIFYIHRQIEEGQLYYFYGLEKGHEISIHCVGIPVLLDVFHGIFEKISNYVVQGEYTVLNLEFEKNHPYIILFTEDLKVLKNLKEEKMKESICVSVEGEWSCSYCPTMDNTYGDYRLPIEENYIGIETRQFEVLMEEASYEEIQKRDEGWKKSTYSFGPYAWICSGNEQQEKEWILMEEPTLDFKVYSYSMQWGIEGDAGYQGSYHGLKGKVSDDFLGLGEKIITMEGSDSCYRGQGPYYVFAIYVAETQMNVMTDMGEKKPDAIWLNHNLVEGEILHLNKGNNYVLLKYNQSGRTHFVLRRKKEYEQKIPLVTEWYQNPDILLPDCYANAKNKIGWYRFIAPPGMYAMQIKTMGKVQVWVNQKQQKEQDEWYVLDKACETAATIFVRIEQEPGFYKGAAFASPVKYLCNEGIIRIGQKEEELGLQWYSGGIVYEKKIFLQPEEKNVKLKVGELGEAVQVWVNGRWIENLIMKPYECDITSNIKSGENDIKLICHNTLKNHMKTIPTNFNKVEE